MTYQEAVAMYPHDATYIQVDDVVRLMTQAELDAAWPTVSYNNDYAQVEATRRTQYEAQSDGLYFEWQRGTNTKEAWEAAVQAVKDANPYPPSPTR